MAPLAVNLFVGHNTPLQRAFVSEEGVLVGKIGDGNKQLVATTVELGAVAHLNNLENIGGMIELQVPPETTYHELISETDKRFEDYRAALFKSKLLYSTK
jgi:hypothetical protein